MIENAVVGLKPGAVWEPLFDLARAVIAPGGRMHLVALVKVATDDDEPQRLRATEQELEKASVPLRREGFHVSTEADLFIAGAGPQLARIAEDRQADLLIVGMGHRSRVGKALLGSDAQSVLLHAGRPVLTTRIG